MTELRVPVSDEFVEQVAQRAAAIVLAGLGDSNSNGYSEFLTVGEAAELLRSSRQRVYDLLSERRLTRFKDGSRVLVLRAELMAHLGPTGPKSLIRAGVRA
jgi:excisionase family DNA binding protein